MTDQTAAMEEHTITLERVVDAPREVVWRAFTDPDELSKWWGPAGFTTPREKIEVDLRTGGAFKLTMVGPDGQEYPNDGHYGVVEPLERYSFGGKMEDHPMMESVETTISFSDVESQSTKIVVRSSMVCLPALVDMANAGWGSQLDKLGPLLAG